MTPSRKAARQAALGIFLTIALLTAPACRPQPPFGYEPLQPVFNLPGVRTEHYFIYSQMADETTYDLALRLEALYQYYARRFADEYFPIDFPKQVFLFNNREDYVAAGGHATMPGLFMGGHDEVGARLMAIAYDTNFGALTMLTCPLLYHEAFHQFVAVEISQAGNVNRNWPTWLDEGHGTLFNNLIWTGDGWIDDALTVSYIYSAAESVPGFIPLQDLINVSGEGWHQLLAEGRVWPVYMQSMSLLHFLYYAQDGKHRPLIDAYVRQASTNVNGQAAADLADKIIAMEPEFLDWFKANMLMPDGSPNLRVTGAKYYEAMTAMATSYLARAHARGQRFTDAQDFLNAAADNKLRLAPLGDSQWLPDTLRQEMLWWLDQLAQSHGPIEITLERSAPSDPPAIIVSQPAFGLVLKGSFSLDDQRRVADVNVQFLSCPSVNLTKAEEILSGQE